MSPHSLPGWKMPCNNSGAISRPAYLCWFASASMLSLPLIFRSPPGFPPNYLVSLTISDLASVRPSLGHNRAPAGLELLVSALSTTTTTTTPARLFRPLQAAPRSLFLQQCLHTVVGTALFPLLPYLLGREFQIPSAASSPDGFPSAYLRAYLVAVPDSLYFLRLLTKTPLPSWCDNSLPPVFFFATNAPSRTPVFFRARLPTSVSRYLMLSASNPLRGPTASSHPPVLRC